MKFGKLLEDVASAKFRGCYIDYKDLKKALKVWSGQERDNSTVQEVTHWSSSFLRLGPNPELTPEMRLQGALHHELERVSKAAGLEATAIKQGLDGLEEDIKKPGASGTELSYRLDEIGEDIIQLKRYAQVNFTGFRKILKKFDKCSQADTKVTMWFMAEVVRAPFMNIEYDTLLAQMNRLALAIRPKLGLEEFVVPKTSTTFDLGVRLPQQGAEVVYLVDPKDTIEVKVMLSKYLVRKGPPLAPLGASQRPRMASVYLDTADLGVYRANLAWAPEAPTPPPAFIEFRHAEGDAVCIVYEGSPGKRTELIVNRVEALKLIGGQSAAVGSFPMDAAARVAGVSEASSPKRAAATWGVSFDELFQQRQSPDAVLPQVLAAVKQGQRPTVQVSYVRTYYQDQTGSFIVILDEEPRVARATAPLAPLGSDYEPFPRTVLTVVSNVMTPGEVPKWLRFISDRYVQVPGFSKAAYATAHLLAKDASLGVPSWYTSIVSSFSGAGEPLSEAAGAGTTPSRQVTPLPPQPQAAAAAAELPSSRLLHEFGTTAQEAARWADLARDPVRDPAADTGGGLGAPLLGGGAGPARRASRGGPLKRMLVRLGFLSRRDVEGARAVRDAIVAVQPKTLFSNERTFLEWMHFSIMLAAVGIVTMHAGAAHVNVGRGLVILSVCLTMWSFHTFSWRADALDTKEDRDYQDPIGPPLLVLCLLVGLGVSTARALLPQAADW